MLALQLIARRLQPFSPLRHENDVAFVPGVDFRQSPAAPAAGAGDEGGVVHVRNN